MTPKVQRRLVFFFAGLSAGGVLAVFALVLPARSQVARGVPPCGDCGKVERAAPAEVPADGYEKLGPPKAGEWRAAYREPPQSFEEYVRSKPNRKCEHRGTFYIQPLATPEKRRSMKAGAHEQFEKEIDVMREYGEIYFNVKVKVLDAIPMFEKTYDPARGQCDSTAIIRLLAERIPADALVLIGLTEDDLYSEGLNFVFGEGSLSLRTGVYSLRRYQTADAALFHRRALKLMSHEVGHILSIHHCVTWRCVMQGANTLSEDDSHPLSLCPEDLRKLEWNCGFDRTERYRKLLEITRRLGLQADAEWIEARLPR